MDRDNLIAIGHSTPMGCLQIHQRIMNFKFRIRSTCSQMLFIVVEGDAVHRRYVYQLCPSIAVVYMHTLGVDEQRMLSEP